ncbi:MAG: glycosyl hydrolase family 18 protein [Oscillospiraceae bacterium]|nr:glycosyl hydrolase family 18 protein [Oscillospiraceae bacterium]
MNWPKLQKPLPFLLGAVLAGAMAFYAAAFLDWGKYEKIYPLLAAAAVLLFAAFACAALWATGARKSKLALRVLTAVVLFCFLLFGVSAILNNVLNSGMTPGPRLAIFASFSLCALEAIWLLSRAAASEWRPRWRKYAAGALALAVLVSAGIVQYRTVRLPLPEPVFSATDLIQSAQRTTGTNEFQLAEAQTFNTALIVEAGSAAKFTYWDSMFRKDDTGAAKFSLEAFVDGEWQMIHRGEKIQTQRLCSFDPVTSDRVRVLAETANGEPVLVQSLALYNEPKRANPGLHMSTYYALDPVADEIPPEVAILAQGEAYAREYARWFDVYDTVICIGGIGIGAQGVSYAEGEARYTQRLNALKELIALRSNPEHEVKIICTVFGGGSEYADPILKNHMDALLENILGVIEKFGFGGADVDYETPSSRAHWRRFDKFMARLDEGMKAANPEAILSAAVFSWGMGMSRETLERLDQIQYMDYCEPCNEHAMPTLEGMQRGVARIIRAGADPAKILIGLGTHGYDRNESWKHLEGANAWYCIYPGNKVGCSPALAGDAAAYALMSDLGGLMVFVTQGDRPMDDPLCMALGIENALGRYLEAW